MTLTLDDRATLRRLLERLRWEQLHFRSVRPGLQSRDYLENLAREADLLVPIIERLLKENEP